MRRNGEMTIIIKIRLMKANKKTIRRKQEEEEMREKWPHQHNFKLSKILKIKKRIPLVRTKWYVL
jgi:hypothetical protein